MKRVFVITENEKNEILGMYNLINEQNVNAFPGCQRVTEKSTNISDLDSILNHWKTWDAVNNELNRIAAFYYKTIKDARISCEASLYSVRPFNRGKNVIIVDTRNQFIYLFDDKVRFIARDAIVSGADKQSTDPTELAKAITNWDGLAQKAGFKLVNNQYVDYSGENRTYSPKAVYDYLKQNNMRYATPGIYSLGNTGSEKNYAGGSNNIKHLVTSNNQEIATAIHGYMKTDTKRGEALDAAKKYLKNINDPEAKKDFVNSVSSGNLNLDLSNGCINVSNEFLTTLKKYWGNSVVFVMSESETDYLVNNTINYFNKVLYNNACPSPKSLGAESLDNFA